MAEAKQAKNADELLKQINDFEGTIKGLADNVKALKERIVECKEKYGPDISKWPNEEK